ncbi:metallophosphoesterase [bacterium]|nr:metallophosphoesterase [bacterium]
MKCYFVTDLHGKKELFKKLSHEIIQGNPDIVFIGGDILPSVLHNIGNMHQDFINGFFKPIMEDLNIKMGEAYPEVYLIMGNDDPRDKEIALIDSGSGGLWKYIHMMIEAHGKFNIAGYNFVPPTPFQFKDWERYDVSRYVDPGCVSPEHGYRTVPVSEYEKKWTTIKEDLDNLTKNIDIEKTIFLFHAPPYETPLDKADIAGQFIDHVPIDTNVGSIAIQRFIQNKQPLLTLHGHIHESSRMTGEWHTKIGNTISINAAFEGSKLSLVSFDLDNIRGTLKREVI